MKVYRRTIIEVFVGLLLLTITLIIANIYSIFIISGTSMEPTLYNGEKVVVDKNVYRNTKPRRGEVIALSDPNKPSLLYAKRVLAEENDIVNCSYDGLYINGIKMKGVEPNKIVRYEIKKDYVFVLGDNREVSYDSRDFGLVPLSNVVGEIKYVISHFKDFRKINQNNKN